MYKRSEMKGERVRLDWTTEELKWHPCAMQKPTGYLDELVANLPWKKPRASRFARNAHINIQELVAAADEIKRRARNGERDKRMILVLDSRVAVGALGKGRSSSKYLNRRLRMFTRAFLCYGLVACLVWVSTKFNPADALAEMLLYLLQAPSLLGRKICGSTTAVSVFVAIVVNKTIQHQKKNPSNT